MPPGNGWGQGKFNLGGGFSLGAKPAKYFSFGTGEIFESKKDEKEKFAGLLLPRKPSVESKPEQKEAAKEESTEDAIENTMVKVENAGEENDEILVNERCVLKQLVDHAGPEKSIKKEWVDRGTGTFHLNKDKTTGIARMIIRRDPMDSISINTRIFKEMSPQLLKKGIMFMVIEERKEKDQVINVPVRSYVVFKDANIAQNACNKLKELLDKMNK